MEQSTEKAMIEDLLCSLPESIEEKTEELIKAREDWKTAQLTYEYEFEKIKLNSKLDGQKHTQDELKSLAVIGTYEIGLKVIGFESNYKRKEKELQRLRDELETTMERNYNYRQTMKAFTGTK